MVSQKEVEVRENRLKALVQVALGLLGEGKEEAEVKAKLREVALRNWGLSSTSLYNYVETALVRAQALHEAAKGGA